MKKPLPILYLTIPGFNSMDQVGVDEMARSLQAAGYMPLFSDGKTECVRGLTATRMKRSDYAACVNAAKKLLA